MLASRLTSVLDDWSRGRGYLGRRLADRQPTGRCLHLDVGARRSPPRRLDRDAHRGVVLHLERPPSWANTELVDRDPVEVVRNMKRRDWRPLHTIGSPSPCRSLLHASVPDRSRVAVFPVVTGATGRDRIFDGHPDLTPDLDSEPHVRRSAPVARVTFPRCSTSRRASATEVLTVGTTFDVKACSPATRGPVSPPTACLRLSRATLSSEQIL